MTASLLTEEERRSAKVVKDGDSRALGPPNRRRRGGGEEAALDSVASDGEEEERKLLKIEVTTRRYREGWERQNSEFDQTDLMATATMATAAGAAALLYYTLNRKLQSGQSGDEGEEETESGGEDASRSVVKPRRSRVSLRGPAQAPATWLETISTLSETLRFTYSETLGKWPIGDLAFGINFLLKRQILKPAFTVLVDRETRCFLLVIRGTHSIRDTLTAATAARWIAKLATPRLMSALREYPDYKLKVTASAWLNDLRNQIEQTKILSTVYRSASALGSRLPTIARAKATVAGAGAILRPMSNGTQVVMRRAKNVAQAAWTHPPLRLSSWSCMGPRHQSSVTPTISGSEENPTNLDLAETDEPLLTSGESSVTIETTDLRVITSEDDTNPQPSNMREDDDESSDGEDLTGHGRSEDSMTEDELWQQLQEELYRRTENEESDTIEEIREEEKAAVAEVTGGTLGSPVSEVVEAHRFFPAGKIMHIVSLAPELSESVIPDNLRADNEVGDHDGHVEEKIGIFLTARSLYGKLRLSRTMIKDHFIPIYKRNIEQLISELERDSLLDGGQVM
ncbi:hypothetical protein QJS04_geneDACA004893 [Acorus gramineus]|uniref:Mono-/di-acylglycerol lipase N-terminal domain-containing protein n=1 Tax=Acorus gramineus TaxID=55184 RepID=A0AAV9BW10_ACOGR|nr:hypothetical protein QJS04_geneDACA004893 [Acorus gramineus]